MGREKGVNINCSRKQETRDRQSRAHLPAFRACLRKREVYDLGGGEYYVNAPWEPGHWEGLGYL